ncbi:hypothetical protein Gohar_006631, partial [Gossypium harknessii]|nr:hypothetical protein [Gossypium harknessii]
MHLGRHEKQFHDGGEVPGYQSQPGTSSTITRFSQVQRQGNVVAWPYFSVGGERTAVEQGDHVACFSALEIEGQELTFKDSLNVAKKGHANAFWLFCELQAMEVELEQLYDTVNSIHEEMFYFRARRRCRKTLPQGSALSTWAESAPSRTHFLATSALPWGRVLPVREQELPMGSRFLTRGDCRPGMQVGPETYQC